jgi:HK97 family phage major capsid protein
MRLLDLRERRAAVVDEMRGLLASDLNDEGRSRFEALKTENGRLEKDIGAAEYLAEAERRMQVDPRDIAGDGTFEQECRQVSLVKAIASQVPGLHVDGGRELEVSKELQRRSGRSHEGITIPSSLFEQRVLTTAAPATGPGSQIIATDYRGDQFVDILRAKLVVRRLGATVLSNLTGNVAIPRRKKSNVAYWVAENTAITPSDPEFEQIALTPKHVASLVEFSRNLLLQTDNPSIEQLVRQDFAAIIAEAIDKAAIKGGGANEPVGILGTAGIGSFTLATPTWANVLEAISDVETANAEGPFAWLTHPLAVKGLRSTLKTTGDTSSNFLQVEPDELAGYPLTATTLLPTDLGVGTDKTALIFGNWSQLLVGYWGDGFDILVNPYAETAYSKGNIQIRGMATCDLAVRQPPAFTAAVDLSR